MSPIARVPGWRLAALSQERAIEKEMAKTPILPPHPANLLPMSREELVAARIASRKRQVLNNLSSKVSAAAAKLTPPEPCECCRHHGDAKKKLRWKCRKELVVVHPVKKYPKECWPDRLDRSATDEAKGWHANNYATFTEADALAEED
ncbi:MAG: hypothetical protein Q9218_003420 [Villophora microphyllina]